VKARLALATTNEKRQHNLYAAQGGMNTVFAATRDRLRILGKSDVDISEIEAAPWCDTSSGASAPVFLIGDLSKVWLVANVREDDAPRLRKDARMEVSVLAFPNQTFHARLTYLGTAIDPITHRAEVDNMDDPLKPDMYASSRIITGEATQSAAVSEIAVIHAAERAHVWAGDPEDRALIRDGMVEVREGLKPDGRIVTSGGDR
jgi:cobalt-zinc-cadmium efflux system membrane fusion protein